MRNINLSEKGLGLVSPPHLVYDFSRKNFLMLHSVNWSNFHNDVENIKYNLVKNSYPPFLIDKVMKKYLDHKISSNKKELKDAYDVDYFKLPYIRNLLRHIENKISKLRK